MQHWSNTIIILMTIWVKFCHLWFSFLNAFEIENSMSLWWNIIKTLCGKYGSNHIVCIVSWLEFAGNIAKFNIDQTTYNVNKDWSKFTKWTTWISPYCPWLKFFKNISTLVMKCRLNVASIWIICGLNNLYNPHNLDWSQRSK